MFKPRSVTKFALILSLALPPGTGARAESKTGSATTRSQQLGNILRSCAMPKAKQTNLIGYLYEDSKVERGRFSRIRQGLADVPYADFNEEPPLNIDGPEQKTLKDDYEVALQLAARESAMMKIMAIEWRASAPDKPAAPEKIAAFALRHVCNSGCSTSLREPLRLKALKAMESIQKMPRAGAEALAEEISENFKGLNSILAFRGDAIDMNYYNYLDHFAQLLNTEIGPLFLMSAIMHVTGKPRKESDLSCESGDCIFPAHATDVSGRDVMKAIREYRQIQLYHWSAVRLHDKEIERDRNIADHFRFAPNTVLQVHAQTNRFDGLLCEYITKAELQFGHERALEELAAQGFAFSGRISFWLASGIGGFGGMYLLAAAGATVGFVALLTIATGIMTLLTVIEVGHRIRMTGRKTEEARKVHQAIVSGNASSERMHMWMYMLEHIEAEKRTTGFIVAYESLTVLASMGLAKLFVKVIPKNYARPDQVFRLIDNVRDTAFNKFLKSKYGITNRVDLMQIWPSLSKPARAEIILQARAARFNRDFFFPTYFAKEMFDAWELYPNHVPGPGAAPISCPTDAQVFRDPRCYAYCESRSDVFEYRCVDL